MDNDVIEVRKIYKNLRRSPTHIVQSSEVATACVCQNLFKLSYPYGVITGNKDFLIANTVHDIMSLCIGSTIIENWEFGIKDYQTLANRILKESSSTIESVINYTKQVAREENRVISDYFDDQVQSFTNGLFFALTKRLMKKFERPNRAITEVTITNTKNNHEGRIDALLEYPHGKFALLDWKTYDLSNTISGKEKWQLISNVLLANYRYTGDEQNWNKYIFSSIIHFTGAYFPRLETVQQETQKIIDNRRFAYNVLCDNKVIAQKPNFCPVCDTNSEGSKECRFYREDSRLAYEGMLPAQYDKIRKQFYGKRYDILKGRAETHLNKYLFENLVNKYGEEKALEKLEKTGTIHSNYKYEYVDEDGNVHFSRENNNIETFLEPTDIVRVIGKEDGIPLLCCISEQASVIDVSENSIVLKFRSKIAVERAKKQLFYLPIVLLDDVINLTRIMLAPIHEFHKLAADIFIHKDCLK